MSTSFSQKHDDTDPPRPIMREPMVSPEQAFAVWAPPESLWSDWVKPLLFANGLQAILPDRVIAKQPTALIDGSWMKQLADHALVFDLPAARSVEFGVVAALHGFRPIPLYNCTTGPGTDVISVSPIVRALLDATPTLQTCTLAPDAPPAFLLDADRLGGPTTIAPLPKTFDNRWIVFPQDFPSALKLRAARIRGVTVVRERGRPLSDLRVALRAWRRDGLPCQLLELETKAVTPMTRVFDMTSAFGDWFNLIFHGLRRNHAGGFGGQVPEPSESGGGAFM